MKNFKKGFTLVEMLIVVVIIGILAAALLPRLLSAQSSARDSARMSAIQQIAASTAAFLQETGEYPTWSGHGSTQNLLSGLITNGNVSSLPQEPQKGIQNIAIEGESLTGSFGYAILKKNGIDRGAIVFVAKMERPWGANYVLDSSNKIGSAGHDDVSKIYICRSVKKGALQVANSSTQECGYTDESQLYYIWIY